MSQQGGPPLHQRLMQMVTGSMVTQILHVAAKVGVADQLASGARDVEELAARNGTHAPTLYRLLRALASIGIVAEIAEGTFVLTPLGGALRSDAPDSVRPLAVLLGEPFYWASWGRLEDSVRTGKAAFEAAHGMPFFEYVAAHTEASAAFDAWMARQSALATGPLVASYDFSGLAKVVDVGGGRGAFLTAVLEAHPSLRGVLYDLPHAVEGAEALRSPPLAERCEIVGGSFFDGVPAGGDAYLLKNIVHDWDDERTLAILRACRAAMHDGARLLVLECVVPAGNEPHIGKFLDIGMLVLNAGKERTEAEYRSLYEAAGLTLTRIVPTGTSLSYVEGVPSAER